MRRYFNIETSLSYQEQPSCFGMNNCDFDKHRKYATHGRLD